VERAVDLLSYLGDGKEVKLEQAAKVLNLSRRQVQGIARALANKGFLLQDTQDETLRLGPKIVIQQPYHFAVSAVSTPKGIDDRTLQDIKEKLNELPSGWECTSVELGQLIGVTRVTARRYLEFLTALGVVRRRHQYVQVGRPIAKYKVIGALR